MLCTRRTGRLVRRYLQIPLLILSPGSDLRSSPFLSVPVVGRCGATWVSPGTPQRQILPTHSPARRPRKARLQGFFLLDGASAGLSTQLPLRLAGPLELHQQNTAPAGAQCVTLP